jgi:hypothetical protein
MFGPLLRRKKENDIKPADRGRWSTSWGDTVTENENLSRSFKCVDGLNSSKACTSLRLTGVARLTCCKPRVALHRGSLNRKKEVDTWPDWRSTMRWILVVSAMNRLV